MAVSVKKSASIGLESVWYGKRNAEGLFIGSEMVGLPATAAATESAMRKLRGVKTWPLGLQEAERVTATGDDGPIFTRQFKPIELPSGSPTFSISDLEFAAMAMGIKVREFGADAFLGLQPDQLTFQDMVLMTASSGASQDDATLGSTVYSGEVYPACQVFYSGHSGRTERQPTDFALSVTAQMARKYPWGPLFTLADDGFERAPGVQYHAAAHRRMIGCWIGDDTEVSFNLAYRLAGATADYIQVYVDGVPLTWAASAPTAGQFSVTVGATFDTVTLGEAAAGTGETAIVNTFYKWQA